MEFLLEHIRLKVPLFSNPLSLFLWIEKNCMNQWIKMNVAFSIALPFLFTIIFPIYYICFYSFLIQYTIAMFLFSLILVVFNFYSLKIYYEFAHGEVKKILVTAIFSLCNLTILCFWFLVLFSKSFVEGLSGILK